MTSEPTAGTTFELPTVQPTALATETPAQSQPPTAQPSYNPVDNYGASTPLFNDGFDDPSSGWVVGTNERGSVAYADGVLQVTASSTGSWQWTRRLAGSTSNAMELETLWTGSGSGYQGLLCADSDDQLWGAMHNAAGEYAFIRVDGQGTTILSEGQLDPLRSFADGSFRFALDCAGTQTGSFRLQLHPAGTNIGVQYFGAPGEGPPSFDRVGIYAESTADSYSSTVDFVIAFGGDGDTSMSPEAVELMTHVPTEWQPKCFESFASVFMVGAVADILCQPGEGRSDYAEYIAFATQVEMDAGFDYLVNKWLAEVEPGQDCETGPYRGGYTIGDEPAGQLLCAPSITGTRLDWTHDELLILSTLIDLEGSYADMYADWQVAGPN